LLSRESAPLAANCARRWPEFAVPAGGYRQPSRRAERVVRSRFLTRRRGR